MRGMPFVFVHPIGDRIEVRGSDAAHLARSLRVRRGERVEVVDPGDGSEGRLLTMRVETVASDRVTGRVERSLPHRPEPSTAVQVALALLPASALEAALSRCTELGAAGFVVVRGQRSVVRAADERKIRRWAAICREAAMLAGRLRVPPVRGPVEITALAEIVPSEVVLLDRGAGRRLAELRPGPRTLLIGPEGGWTPEEVEAVAERARLGPRNLRAENAAAAALAIALSKAGDL
jgi:16S rRNA (uracil1498-N3)-methyltransferase